MEIVITEHAKERMIERLGCKDSKLQKIARKAWLSNEKCSLREIANSKFHSKGRVGITHYRKLMGMIYVFHTPPSRRINLITVMPPTTNMARRTSQRKIELGSDFDRRKERKSLLKTD